MKVYVPKHSTQSLGGGFLFIPNLKKGLGDKVEFVDSWDKANVILIVGVTMTERSEIKAAKEAKKKVILRIDNMPKDSRNKGTAFSRMRDFGQMADFIVFQSQWAKDYVGNWLTYRHNVNLKKSRVIYNGIDPNYFYFHDNPKQRGETYVYCTFNTDENKRYPEAAYDFYQRNFAALNAGKPQPLLTIAGNMSDKLKQYNFDFFNGEKIKFIPPIENRMEMGNLFRSSRYLYFPAFADASPNTVGEAMACGCEVLLVNPIGGTKEVVEEYSKKIITIQDMAEQYFEIF